MIYVEKQRDKRDSFMSELGNVREVAGNFAEREMSILNCRGRFIDEFR